jgi:putative DNA methylase
MTKPRLLIEEWLPVQALSVECMRENSTGLHPPPNRLHVWWARKPLVVSRAAVLGSLLPAGFDRRCFERLLGFGLPSEEIIARRERMDAGERVDGGFGCGRAFANPIRDVDADLLRDAIGSSWDSDATVLDHMAGGGSIPLEAARLGLNAIANELNPVACSILEATVDYPLRFGAALAKKTRHWGKVWEGRAAERLRNVYPKRLGSLVHGYIFARTVPCPDTGHPTPLVHDWSLSRPAGGPHIVAEPIIIDKGKGKWTIRVRKVGKEAGDLPKPPQPTYFRGKGMSLFTNTVIPDDYIKAMAQSGRMGSVLYAVAVKAVKLDFRPPDKTDLAALEAAERELARLRPQWEKDGIIPTEKLLRGYNTRQIMNYGVLKWADMFSPRQLLALGTLVEELRNLRPKIIAQEGQEMGEAIVHLLALVVDKFANFNSILSRWTLRGTIAGKFDRHDYAFKATYAEMAACVAGSGLEWAIDNVLEAYENLAELPKAQGAKPVTITQGSATNLVDIEDKSITAVVVDPPYADNVMYSEMADFFYVWLKRTQGHRRPEWFSSYLCDHDQEAIVNYVRHDDNGALGPKDATQRAHEFYQKLMTDSFREAHRVLRDDGVLTVMFTHKKQEAWAALFESLIDAGFTITATWPVQTESAHSLQIARKNSAQSTVILVARKRDPNAGKAYYDANMQSEIRKAARSTAQRLKDEGLNPVDQLVGTFGPAMRVFTQYEEVRLDTGERVSVADAIQLAADEVAQWRLEQLAARGLEDVDPESRFYLLCWDVLQAEEFRFNEAMLLGRAVGMDVDRLKDFGLLERDGEKVKILPAASRRRDKPIKAGPEQILLTADPQPGSKNKKSSKTTRKVHPQDDHFSSAIDMCHAIALRYADTGGGDNGIAEAKSMALQKGWNKESPCCKLMEALLNAAPPAVRFPGKKKEKTAADRFPEFRAWHAMLKPVFGIDPPEWKEPTQPLVLDLYEDEEEEELDE